MGSIKLDNLRNTGKVDTGYTYKDVRLDIEEANVSNLIGSDRIADKDIKVSYDVEAIMNSLNNIFKTIPGERFLVPEFGINLKPYIFRPITESIANRIGNDIVRGIERWEPRVIVDRVSVVGRPELHEYEVDIRLTIISMKRQVSFNGVLNRDSDLKIRDITRNCS